jgi:lipopolysaccharide transport system permease protein
MSPLLHAQSPAARAQKRAGVPPLRPLGMLVQEGNLIGQLARREIASRYRGSMLGILWAVVNPLFLLGVYTFVFGQIFRLRWNVGTESTADFAVLVFAGMIVHGFVAECLGRAPGLVVANPNYVKKVVFPLATLVWPAVLAALFQFAVNFAVLLAFLPFSSAGLHATIVVGPLVILPLVLVTLGACWFLAAVGVYLRDIGQTVGLLVTLLLFLSPVFYPLSAVPAAFRPLVQANPLTFIIEQFRRVVVEGAWPDWIALAGYAVGGLVVAWAGLFWFERSRKGFADVL